MWKTIISTFILVFLAELGDKTQLSTMLIASKNGHFVWHVFLGSSIALVLSSLIGVLLGTAIHKYIPANYIQYGSGIAFLIIGLLLLLGKM